MENTLENKAKFFAQYWGQNILRYHNAGVHTIVDENVLNPKKNNIKHSWLELTPLSAISDEDAIEVALLCGGANSVSHGKEILKAVFGNHFNNRYSSNPPAGYYTDIIDFVRSKGYAVPYLNLTVNQMIEYGWVKLKNS